MLITILKNFIKNKQWKVEYILNTENKINNIYNLVK